MTNNSGISRNITPIILKQKQLIHNRSKSEDRPKRTVLVLLPKRRFEPQLVDLDTVVETLVHEGALFGIRLTVLKGWGWGFGEVGIKDAK